MLLKVLDGNKKPIHTQWICLYSFSYLIEYNCSFDQWSMSNSFALNKHSVFFQVWISESLPGSTNHFFCSFTSVQTFSCLHKGMESNNRNFLQFFIVYLIHQNYSFVIRNILFFSSKFIVNTSNSVRKFMLCYQRD